MENTFKGLNPTFPNHGIHFLVNEALKFRRQLTVRKEARSQSGWFDALNVYMKTELDKLADTVERITYYPQSKSLATIEAEAADTSRSLADDFNARSVHADDLLMPATLDITISADLTGADPNLPQPTPDLFPNDHFRGFVIGLDRFVAEATRLDSRFQPQSITKYESAMLRRFLEELWTVCVVKGGEENRSDIPTGTLPAQEPLTFGGTSTGPR